MPDIAGYKIYYGTSLATYTQTIQHAVASTGTLSYDLTGLTNCTDYYVAVSAYDIYDNESGLSGEVSATSGSSGAPAAPVGLTATTVSGSVTLHWNANIECDLGSYAVYRSTTAGSNYQLLGTATGASTVTYTDSTVVDGTTYYYKIRATDIFNQESADSNEVAIPAGDTIAPTTTASPVGGTYLVSQSVRLVPDETATIYCTTDGTDPVLATSL